MHLHHFLTNPMLVWFVLLAFFLTVATWPARGWRAITQLICCVVVALVVLLHEVS